MEMYSIIILMDAGDPELCKILSHGFQKVFKYSFISPDLQF